MMINEAVLVWALFLFPKGGGLPEQYGPFLSEPLCKKASKILSTPKTQDAICLPVVKE